MIYRNTSGHIVRPLDIQPTTIYCSLRDAENISAGQTIIQPDNRSYYVQSVGYVRVNQTDSVGVINCYPLQSVTSDNCRVCGSELIDGDCHTTTCPYCEAQA